MRIDENDHLNSKPVKSIIHRAISKGFVNVFSDFNIPECKNDATYVAPKDIPMVKDPEAVLADLQVKWNKNAKVKDSLFHGSAQDLNKCLQGTPLEGLGQAFLDAQEKYGVNALLLMSIAKVESGYGVDPARDKTGVHKYNISGLKKRSGGYQNNESYAQCVDSCASSLKRLYFNAKPVRATIDQIRKQYCPGNPKWATEVAAEMNRLSGLIMSNYT